MKKNLSQLKRQRQNEKRRLRNRALRSGLRTNLKTAREAIAKDIASDGTRLLVKGANRSIDRMVTRGLLHRNTAARYKSRMMGRYNKHLKEAGILETRAAPIPVEAPPAVDVAEEAAE